MAFSGSPVCAKLSIALLSALLVSSVVCRVDGQGDRCRECWVNLGRVLNVISHRYDSTDSDIEGVLQPGRMRSDLLALLLSGKGRQSLQDSECYACWVVLLKLAESQQGLNRIDKTDDDTSFDSFDKRVMLNNGWV